MVDVLEHCAEVAAVLDGLGIPHVFIGGLGRNAWGRPRATEDVDVQIVVSADGWRRCVEAFEAAGYILEQEYGVSGPPPDNARLRSRQGVRLDVMLDKVRFQDDAVRRGIEWTVQGRILRVVSPEDLVLYKLLASRPKDVDDIEDVLRTRQLARLAIDWGYIEGHAGEWGMLPQVAALKARFGGQA